MTSHSRVQGRAEGPLCRPGKKVYRLAKFRPFQPEHGINQKVIVEEGQRSPPGDVLADGPATHNGELALGKNLLVAFMPWEGYNYEDAIILSERLVQATTC